MSAPFPQSLQQWLPRLGVFQGGAQETLLMAITGLAAVGPRPELATGVTKELWPELRQALIDAHMMREQAIEGSARPYLHILGDQPRQAMETLEDDQRKQLQRHYQRHYFQFAGQLKKQAIQRPHQTKALADLEMPNLIHAASGAFDAGEEWSGEFMERLLPFLDHADQLTERQQLLARFHATTQPVGSSGWIRHKSNAAERLMRMGQYPHAQNMLSELLAHADKDSFAAIANRARLAYCHSRQGATETALDLYQQALTLSDKLPMNTALAETCLNIHMDRAQLLTQAGREQEAGDAGHQALTVATQYLDSDQQINTAAQLAQLTGNESYHFAAQQAFFHSSHGQAQQQEQAEFIQTVCTAQANTDPVSVLAPLLAEARANDWNNGAQALEQICQGERDTKTLCGKLSIPDGGLILAILKRMPM